MIQFQENARTEGRTEGWKDRQTLLYRTLQATTGGLLKGAKPGQSKKRTLLQSTLTNLKL